jgi:hypothetical protein
MHAWHDALACYAAVSACMRLQPAQAACPPQSRSAPSARMLSHASTSRTLGPSAPALLPSWCGHHGVAIMVWPSWCAQWVAILVCATASKQWPEQNVPGHQHCHMRASAMHAALTGSPHRLRCARAQAVSRVAQRTLNSLEGLLGRVNLRVEREAVHGALPVAPHSHISTRGIDGDEVCVGAAQTTCGGPW